MKNKTQHKTVKTISISAKCSDLFSMTALDSKGTALHEYDGYVPDWFPGQHYGDYVQLDIDIKTGKIVNWSKVLPDRVSETCKSQNNRLVRKAG